MQPIGAKAGMKRVVEWLFSLHYKNKDEKYVQGWYCWPSFMGRWSWPASVDKGRMSPQFVIRTWICKLLIGHEISITEWGWGGGDQKVDCNCRWCDKVIQITPEETRFRFPTFNDWGRKLEFNEDG